MIQLYHCEDARSFRALWMLEELQLDYELKVLPFPPRFAAREFLAVNPLGTVPLLVDGATTMTESAAICQYLVDRHAAAAMNVAPDEGDYGAYLNFLHFGEATLTFPQTLVLRYGKFEREERRNPQVVSDYSRWFLARLSAVEARLETQSFMAAERFTAADVSVGYALMLAHIVGLGDALPHRTQSYLDRLSARDGFQRAKRRQDQPAG